ncbi:hypothetical protein UA08_05151 [Talaromyces atroroseus]|uniref:C2H2-type domain-containing protein n=1 Tax=Talaromyces atroroseus TaxID=1441469 RepID=A0A225AV72_TALAT|nr:hypothetical protein UA08_05151 [Talaromyces atroroseus]OKL59499.1 hypothetical protein UA08_05151 [Talaromyces atroroseus]
MNATFGTGDFLHYNAQYKLLICLECKYAIQKNAVRSHLLRHKIYRGERQRLLSAISTLELAEPDDVQFPSTRREPVKGLPVIKGYRCTAIGCGSLYASFKRMRGHWTESHGLGNNLPEGFACAVDLQTFFRGTKLRYFEVTREASLVENQPQQQKGLVSMPSCAMFSSNPGLDIDLEKLRYFHHFTSTTSLTLPVGISNLTNYWQTDVISRALHLRWLMFGLLSISASHLAVLSGDETVKRTHRERSAQYRQGFLAGWTGSTAGDDTDVLGMGVRVTSIQRCCMWTSTSIPLQSFVTTINGYTDPNSISMKSNDTPSDTPTTNQLLSSNNSIRTDIPKAALLEHFYNLPYRMAEKLGKPSVPTDFMAIMSAISALIECCPQFYEANDPETLWMAMQEWLKRVSGRFTQMLTIEKHPATLIVFAQWQLLVARAERDCWFLRGMATRMLCRVIGELDENRASRSLIEESMGWALEST